MLPVVESRDDIDLQQFAKKTQKQMSTALDIVRTNISIEEINTWKESKYNNYVHCTKIIIMITCYECACIMILYIISMC